VIRQSRTVLVRWIQILNEASRLISSLLRPEIFLVTVCCSTLNPLLSVAIQTKYCSATVLNKNTVCYQNTEVLWY
jgi:hypothetical protein